MYVVSKPPIFTKKERRLEVIQKRPYFNSVHLCTEKKKVSLSLASLTWYTLLINHYPT